MNNKEVIPDKDIREITDWYQKNRDFYKRLALKIELIIKEILENEGIIYHDVDSRAKEVKSFVKKASKEKYKNPKAELMDLAGIRINAYVESDVKKICRIIEREFIIHEEHSGDKSEDLGEDKVGYRSIHYVAELNGKRSSLTEYKRFKGAKFEIQVRTVLQHAWAEIEHDRNYKLTGELPVRKDIKRRFSLLAAVLEMADREFDSIVNDLDIYMKDVKEETKQGHLDIPIDSISLKEYLDNKLKDIKTMRKTLGDVSSVAIRELKKFGIEKLSELDSLITKDFLEKFKEFGMYEGAYLSFLRIVMIVNNKEKYFTEAMTHKFTAREPFVQILQEFEIPVEELKKYINIL